ncbi:cell wall assembly and cell proliferation coordinating protein, partial [Metschnikowia bicuspidata var. bicuspidata NRRL YB-4993]
MTLSLQMKEFFYCLSATDKYSDFDSRKSFNRVNQPEIETSLLGATHANDSTSSLSKAANLASSEEGVHEVRLAWRHIKKWLHKHSEDMNNSLLAPCTEADINELQKDLDCEFPACLKEFLRLTDGQSQFNENGCCGLFYGLRLLSIDEIAVMTESWRKVHESILQNTEFSGLQKYAVNSSFADNNLGTSAGFKMRPSEMKVNQNEFPEQYSVPPHTVHSIYAHSQWIPLINDETGNFIGIDLSPGASDSSAIPAAKWGQVILFGRDFDIKYKIADTFGDFLLIFANDLEKGNWDLRSSSDNEDMVSGVDAELVFVDHETKKELPYLNVLKDRATTLWISSLSAEN